MNNQKKQEDVSNEILAHEHGLSSRLCDCLELIAEKKANEEKIKKPGKLSMHDKFLNLVYSFHKIFSGEPTIEETCSQCGHSSFKYKCIIGVTTIDDELYLTKLYNCKTCGREIEKTEKKKKS